MARKSKKNSNDSRIDDGGMAKAEASYKDAAANHAKAAQRWKEAQETRDVRLRDLVKVHAQTPFDTDSAARVANEAAKAVQREEQSLLTKREAKQALDEAWTTWRNFDTSEPVRPLIPDEEEATEDAEPEA